MHINWQTTTLEEVCLKITDGAHNSPKSVAVGKPMASVKDLTRFGVDLKGSRNISFKAFEMLVRQGCQPLVGDVLIAKDGNSALDTVCNVKKPLDAVLLSSVAILRPDPKKIDSDFLKYYFTSQETINYLKRNFISGAAIPRVVLKDFKKARIKLPPLHYQKNISSILSSLDAKIEINRQVNQTLEEIAQAIFKSWFVDFEPVKAKIEAKANGQDTERAAMCAISGKSDAELDQLSPNQFSQLCATAGIFPEDLSNSELGLIPIGWKAGNIGDVAIAKGGYAYKSIIFKEVGHPVVKIKNIVGDGTVDLTDCQCIDDSQAQITSGFKLSNGDLLMAMTGATVGKVGLVVLSEKTAYLNQRVAKFESKEFKSRISWFLFCAFRRASIFEQVVGTAQGSAQPNISSKGIESARIVVPTSNCLHEFIDKVEPLFSKWMSNQNEIYKLAAIRDALLPRLLSGEIELESNHTSS